MHVGIFYRINKKNGKIGNALPYNWLLETQLSLYMKIDFD